METDAVAARAQLRARLLAVRAEMAALCERLDLLIEDCGATVKAVRGEGAGNGVRGPRLFARDVLPLGEAKVMLARQEVRHAGGTQRLTPTEWQLLTFLLAHPEVVHTRVDLATGAWGQGFAERNSEVEVYVSRLRRKLGPAGSLLETVRGQGYRMMLARPPAVVALPTDRLRRAAAGDGAAAANGAGLRLYGRDTVGRSTG